MRLSRYACFIIPPNVERSRQSRIAEELATVNPHRLLSISSISFNRGKETHDTHRSHFWSWLTRVLSFTAMKHKPFRKPRIRKFGDVSRLTQQKQPSPQGLYDQL